jgi:hypothetical protein
MTNNVNSGVMAFRGYADLTGDVIKSGLEYVPNGADHIHWPRVLDTPPITELPIPTIMERAQGSIADSFGAFKSVVQTAYQAGYKTISVVPLKVFNLAKKQLSNVHLKLWNVRTVLENVAYINACGAIFIVLGVIGIYLTQSAAGASSQINWKRIASYASLIGGLGMVVYATIMASQSANELGEVFRDLPSST